MSENDKIGRPGSKRLVLVVEDNDLNREILCALLEEEFEVLEACDGVEGLELLAEHYKNLSLILLDVYMPRCDGFEFLRRMRSDDRYDTVPVVVATASDATEDEIACLKLGANDFVLKPYNFEIMLNRVSNLIRLRESASIVNELTWDNVTNLYNKEFFYRAVEEAYAESPESAFDLICSDVENFQSLIERYGEANCDKLLAELASNMSAIDGLVAGGRIGTDLFALLVEHSENGWDEQLQAAIGNLPLANVNVKFGIVENVDHEMAVQQACSRALNALETIKGLHGVVVALFDDEVHERQMLEQTIRDSMEDALKSLQFSVFYQPKHNVHTERVGGAEALVRWSHPEIGFVSPGLFIPVFEQNGFITQLDMYVWEEVCREIKRCKEIGLPVVPISVNASRHDFDVSDLPNRLAELADKYGIERELMHVELTETAYSDNPERVTCMLHEMKHLGFLTELDDFGAGYSSLVSLNTLPLDVMKLDMSMVRKATELNDYRIVESTIKLAQVLGLKTVVEGVETAEQAQRVKEMGCDLIQGYYYSRPLNQEDFEAYLAENS